MASNICKILIYWIGTKHNVFFKYWCRNIMFYSVELQMAGVILLTAMAVGGISLWLKRRKIEKETSESVEEDISENL